MSELSDILNRLASDDAELCATAADNLGNELAYGLPVTPEIRTGLLEALRRTTNALALRRIIWAIRQGTPALHDAELRLAVESVAATEIQKRYPDKVLIDQIDRLVLAWQQGEELVMAIPANRDASERNLVFISYAHKDQEWLLRLTTALKPVVRLERIQTWVDKEKLEPGVEWLKVLRGALAHTKVGVMLVSHNYLASDFIMKEEFPALCEAAESGELQLFWIAVTDSNYEYFPCLTERQAANSNGTKPLDQLSEQELSTELRIITKKLVAAYET